MIWLKTNDYENQKFIILRLYAPQNEKIFLDFNPLKISDEPDWNPMWEEWHCYEEPLRIFQQDYQLLIAYFNKIYSTKNVFDGTNETFFDVCSYNWIGKNDWFHIIFEIEKELGNMSDDEKQFFIDFLEWLKKALNYTSIIVVEGNL